MSNPGNADDQEVKVARSVARDVAAQAAAYPFARKDDPRRAESELGGFAYQWVLATLQKMGVLREPGEAYEPGELERRLGVAPKYGRYFAALIRRLEERGLVAVDGQVIRTTERVREGALGNVEEQVAAFKKKFVKRYPACAGLLGFMACCLDRFDEIITGQIDVADVLFQDGSMDVFAEVFRGDVVSDYFNRLVAEAVRGAAVRLRAGSGAAKVRIVEVGAGTGGTTAAILEALQPLSDAVEFCFTDISPSFTRYAKKRFAGRYPWLDYRTLNIEKDLPGQGFDLHRFDVVVAANVLHDTRDIEFTLEQTRKLLKPGGLLVLNEFTAVKDCLFFSGALLHGYWLFEDPDRRLRDSCLLDVPRWSPVLERAGFTLLEALVLPTQSVDGEHSQSVMLCEAGGEAAESAGQRPEKSGIIGQHVEKDILRLLGEERAAAYTAQRPLMEMGLDSIELVELKSSLRGRYGVKLPSAFLFEHATQEKIVKALEPLVSDSQLGELPPEAAAPELPQAVPSRPAARSAAGQDAIAIVGAACRLSGGATSPEAFWKLLERGGDGIVPLPAGRWEWPSFIDVEGKHKGIDQGGFLPRVDELDARFFRTSPREAELMDPQQRLLLELSWEVLEDAGHRPSELAGRKVGVFVGVCQSDYRDVLVAAAESAEAYVGSGTAYAMLANRLSYFFDFKGPSLTVDTACSSSLVALHDAVAAMRSGDCEEALVSGVNLLCSPTISIAYYQAGMLSPTGRCRTFDASADGYVRGEGGVMLLLKPLARALDDGDAIYGLVQGTAVNHGGQAASLTAPKPEAQAEVVESAWRQAGAPADSVGYVEAHGTGTPLGDPIEVSGLTEAFRRLYRAQGRSWPPRPHCALGSVKSNLGHLEGAAGVAGLLKILLSIEHGQIPRTLNFERLNPEIELDGSPFYIAERTAAWPRFRDEQGRELPRRASVSSFGFGGANAHAVVEEYRRSATEAAVGGPCLVPVSARSRDELNERARQLLAFVEQLDGRGGSRARPAGASRDGVVKDLRALLQRRFGLGEECTPDLEWEDLGWSATETRLFLAALEEERGLRLHSRSLIDHPSLLALAGHIAGDRGGAEPVRPAAAGSPAAEPRLEDVAFTLQVGREPMKERAAFVAESWDELAAALRGFLAGNARPAAATSPARRELAELASQWTEGTEVDWPRLDPAARPRRVHLPTYPFVRERYWASRTAEPSPAAAGAARLHPLVHQNTSGLAEQRFSSVFTGREFFLADHRFEGQRLLPGVAYLEMAREAVARSVDGGGGSVRLKNVVWLRPFVAGQDPAELHIGLYPEKTGEIELEAYSGSPEAEGGEVIHAQGVATLSTAGAPPRLDLAAIEARCREGAFTAETCYSTYAELGLEYGAAHRGIESLRVGPGEVIARLALPAAVWETRDRFVLHPSLMDAAVQALIGFTLAEGTRNGLRRFLPFEVRDVEIFAPCVPRMRAVVRRSDAAAGGAKIDRFDIDLCDEEGSVAVRFRGLSTRSTRREAGETPMERAAPLTAAPRSAGLIATGDLHQKVQAALAPAIVKLLKLRDSHVQPDAMFSSLGFDSITFADFARALNHDYGLGLTPTVFFEYPTLERFSLHLAEEHQAVMAPHLAPRQEARPASASRPATEAPVKPAAARSRRSRFAALPRPSAPQLSSASDQEPIAIVGISGRFPMARDVDEFWDNLVSGRDCITEIPPERWDWREIWGDPREDGNRTNVKWGGFIEGVDEFDPLFFNISPREARLMDPQQRLLMLHVWKAIEDAGYSAGSLAGSQTAIFVGAGLTDYDFVLAEPTVTIEDYMAIGTAPSVGPHRMSYFLDLHGPSEPIETACSSSLVAVHRAVCAMRAGQCEMALVGGVGTLLTPHRQISYSKAGMLSPDGRCKTFSSRANGYVRGEGVGILFLKKLRDAEAAGDHIWGVIRGSSENHGGRANSLTAPNPKAQAELLKRAYREADVEPESVSYIEAHGTGTELGDPIEVDGLKAAFRELYRERGTQPAAASCGLGSVKTNIGHLEVAAGVAGIIKVLLQMKHRTLAPSLHCDPPNPYVQLDGSPFFVVREAMEWRTGRDGRGDELPRRAGVSSFSVSGANAHVVIEEYVPRAGQPPRPASPERPVAVVLSARNEERLRERAEGLLAALRKHRWDDGDLIDVAYTLQVGREAMDARFGTVVSSAAELEEKLRSYLAGSAGQNGFYRGEVRGNAEALTMLTSDEDFREVVEKWIDQGRMGKVLDLWVKGLKVDWERFYGDARPRRVSLPTYPFARERYWVKGAKDAKREISAAAVTALPATVPTVGARPELEPYEMVLTPTWEPAEIERLSAAEHAAAGLVAVTGGTEEQRAAILERQPDARLLPIEPGDGIERMRQAIAAWGEVGHIVWIVPPHHPDSMADDSLLAGQEGGVLFGFRLIKALLAEGYGEKPLVWSVITIEAQAIHDGELASPTHAAVHGLIGTMAKEYSHWQVRLVDLPSAGEWPWRDLATLAADPHGNAWAWRGRWYRQQLAPWRPAADGSSPYRAGGVYVVLGGAGGIGEAWSEAVLRRVPARLVWIGRRPLDDTIQARIDRLAALGPAPLYIAADATDRGALEAARDAIKSELGRIDGVIHSAMALHDKSLANMAEDAFLSGLASKVDISVRLAQVFAGEALDFVLFFSSIASFLKWPGQCNYVAGGAFEDAFASRLAAAWPCRVRVINWGYWSIGGLDSERYRAIMARKGLASIELPGAMRMLDLLLTGPVRQLAYLAALGPDALDGASVRSTEWAVHEEEARRAERESRAAEAALTGAGTLVRDVRGPAPREITTEHLTADLRLRVAETLGVDPSILDTRSRPFTDALLGEFGMDSLSSNSLRNMLRRELGVDIPVHLIIGEKVESIVGALYEQLLLQQVSKEPQHAADEDTETFVF